jgi:hypothetical protein
VRTFTHPLVSYDLTEEYEYSEIRGSADLGTKLDAGDVTIINDGIAITTSAALKKIQPEPNTDTGGGGGVSIEEVWAINAINNC